MTSPIKIGISANPRSRLASLQTSCPFDVVWFHCVGPFTRREARRYEEILHAVHAPSRLRGEWFDVDPMEALESL